MKVVYTGISDKHFTKDKIYDTIDGDIYNYSVLDNDGKGWICSKSDFILLSELREDRINKILK